MKVASYLRVSTENQSLEPQRIELAGVITQRNYDLVEEFTDIVSGGRLSRDGLDAMLAKAAAKQFDAILVVKIDRLARSLNHFVRMVGMFDRLGVALIATSQGIDTSQDNPAGRLQMNVLAAVAEFERGIISERTKAGLAAARARGSLIGHPNPNLVPNWQEVTRTWIAETGGFGLKDLAMRLGGVSKSTAGRMAIEIRDGKRAA